MVDYAEEEISTVKDLLPSFWTYRGFFACLFCCCWLLLYTLGTFSVINNNNNNNYNNNNNNNNSNLWPESGKQM